MTDTPLVGDDPTRANQPTKEPGAPSLVGPPGSPSFRLALSTLPPGYYLTTHAGLRLRLHVYRRSTGHWYGWTFVDAIAPLGDKWVTAGKQAPKGSYRGFYAYSIRSVLENPLEAARRYGRETGQCGGCGGQVAAPFLLHPPCKRRMEIALRS